MRKMSITEFKSRISRLISEIHKYPIELERRDKKTAVVISSERYRELIAKEAELGCMKSLMISNNY